MITKNTATGRAQPIIAPNFRCRPDLVKGMPILRESRALAADMPKNLFQEKPPLFMVGSNLGGEEPAPPG
jgi:hypothetical protein